MKNLLLFIAVQLCTLCSFTQITPSSPWIWMKGDNTVDQYGVYGTQGVASSLNKPGARNISSTWRDPAGNLWLLGGMGLTASQNGFLNDLWRFEPSTNKWTWMKGDDSVNRYSVYGIPGTSAPSNKPGGTYSGISWVDPSGNFWLFGGYGYSENNIGLLNALWKYDPALNEWAWVSGDKTVNEKGSYGTRGVANVSNKPGSRYCSQSWTDSNGDLWLFGGYGYGHDENSAGPLNDIWKYSVAINEWTWIKGDSTIESPGLYGTKGSAAPANSPGGRYLSTSWKDHDGNTWLFGGYGYDETNLGNLNDLWKYDPSTNQWTWVSGDNIIDQPGMYGTRGTASTTNKPGSRYIASSWIDLSGELWLFGGYGYDTSQVGYLNDLWRYSPASGKWTWAKGDNIIDQPAIYGTQCMPDSSNKSGARMSSISWTDGLGNLWLFGGYGYDSSSSGSLNDLWKINSDQLILPVRLLYFTGVLNNETVQLQWQTEQEINFSHYTIQRSFDGIHFISIGNVMSNGNNTRNQYSWPDNDLRNHPWSKVYYRLQSVDDNGHFTYSRIILFDRKPATAITAYPNPAVSSINLSFVQKRPGTTSINIYDSKGATIKKEIQTLASGRISLTIDVSTLPAATYLITITNDEFVAKQKFIKQ